MTLMSGREGEAAGSADKWYRLITPNRCNLGQYLSTGMRQRVFSISAKFLYCWHFFNSSAWHPTFKESGNAGSREPSRGAARLWLCGLWSDCFAGRGLPGRHDPVKVSRTIGVCGKRSKKKGTTTSQSYLCPSTCPGISFWRDVPVALGSGRPCPSLTLPHLQRTCPPRPPPCPWPPSPRETSSRVPQRGPPRSPASWGGR